MTAMLDIESFNLPKPFPADMVLASVEVFAGESGVVFAVGIGRDPARPTIAYGPRLEGVCEDVLREVTGRKRISKADREAYVRPLVEAVRGVLREAAES